ncbi:glycosyltransferase family 4 protein [Photobacterium damselae]|uniref:glycosyltransferase family 4 protein n=1 Tax=Photobacterium damselae TaxID=38293 RepID=UPI00254320AC
MKVLILTNTPTPYRKPLFEAIGDKVNLDVVFCSEKEGNRDWSIEQDAINFKYIKMGVIKFNIKGKYIYIAKNIFTILVRGKYDKYILGDASYTTYIAALLLNLMKKEYILWCGYTKASMSESKIGFFLKKKLIKNASSIVSYGSETTRIISKYTSKKIYNTYNCVDNEFFNNLKLRVVGEKKKEEVKTIVYTGQIIERKNIHSLIQAIGGLDNCQLIVIGRGDEKYKKRLEKLAKEEHCKVEFVGVKTPYEIYEIYNRADCFCLPSYDEPWGLVVNEAMLFGLPVVVSDKVGCHYDLIENGINGFVSSCDSRSIRHCLDSVFKTNFKREDIIKGIENKSSPKLSAAAFIKAIS